MYMILRCRKAYLSEAKSRCVTPKGFLTAETSPARSNIPMLASRRSGRLVLKTSQEKAKESEEAAVRRENELGAGVNEGRGWQMPRRDKDS
jgi:hypothetical protein